MSTPARCTLSDLPTDQCAHCTGVSLDEPPELAQRVLGRSQPVLANFPGVCGHCEERYEPDVTIVKAVVDNEVVWCLFDHTTDGRS